MAHLDSSMIFRMVICLICHDDEKLPEDIYSMDVWDIVGMKTMRTFMDMYWLLFLWLHYNLHASLALETDKSVHCSIQIAGFLGPIHVGFPTFDGLLGKFTFLRRSNNRRVSSGPCVPGYGCLSQCPWDLCRSPASGLRLDGALGKLICSCHGRGWLWWSLMPGASPISYVELILSIILSYLLVLMSVLGSAKRDSRPN